MEISKQMAIELIKKQMKDQGCDGDTLKDISLLQPHLFEWIDFFNLNVEDLE